MKKLFGLLLCCALAVTLTACGEKKKEAKKKTSNGECDAIVGGSYTLNFITNNEEVTFESKNVCIACAPDSYEDLPTAEGLEGWYYDAELTAKVEGTSTKDVNPSPKYNGKDCITGYSDMALFAKWN